ncbi:MAG: hypothetical protein JNK26_00280 [Candidatus Doudnabacteria bacterium]|nr:hypothetical protein [Candidatus Doudnabacteria bacterium]
MVLEKLPFLIAAFILGFFVVALMFTKEKLWLRILQIFLPTLGFIAVLVVLLNWRSDFVSLNSALVVFLGSAVIAELCIWGIKGYVQSLATKRQSLLVPLIYGVVLTFILLVSLCSFALVYSIALTPPA